MISEFKVRMVGDWEVFSLMKPLVNSIQIKETNIVGPTVVQLYIIYEYRIGRIGRKKYV